MAQRTSTQLCSNLRLHIGKAVVYWLQTHGHQRSSASTAILTIPTVVAATSSAEWHGLSTLLLLPIYSCTQAASGPSSITTTLHPVTTERIARQMRLTLRA